jgi:hypothetical protein
MSLFRVAWAALAVTPLLASVPPADWVPARWNWTDPKTLDLVSGTPVNCLLVKSADATFAEKATARGIVPLVIVTPGKDPAEAARQAMQAHFQGVVLEGDFPDGTAERIKEILAASKGIVVELTARSRMKLGGSDPIIGTYQGVWPGVQVLENGAHKAGPTGGAWIDTNTGFIRAVRGWGHAAIWLANLPPPSTAVTAERYLQAVCDAAMSGARWVLALDDEFAGRLHSSEVTAVRDWKRIAQHLAFYEKHAEWRAMRSYGKLAVVQDPADGSLLSGGILDMIASRHTPVRAIPRQRLSPDALKGATMAVDVDPQALTPEQREILKQFTRAGGTLLSAPPGSKAPLDAKRITFEEAELQRLSDIWHDVQSMIGRRNLGARLFNVSSMLSNLLTSDNSNEIVVHLVNYSNYPVESVTVHFLGQFRHARLLTPEGVERDLEVYKTEEGSGVDVDRIAVSATLRLN